MAATVKRFDVVKHSKFRAGESDTYSVKNGRGVAATVQREWLTGVLRCFSCNAWCDHIDAVTEYEQGGGACKSEARSE